MSRPLRQIQSPPPPGRFSSSRKNVNSKIYQGPDKNEDIFCNADKENCHGKNEMECTNVSMCHELSKNPLLAKRDRPRCTTGIDEIEEEQHIQQEMYDEEIIRISSAYHQRCDSRNTLGATEESTDISGRYCIPFGKCHSNLQQKCSPAVLYKFTSGLEGDTRLLQRPQPCCNEEIADDTAHDETHKSLSIVYNHSKRILTSEHNLQSKEGSAFHKVQRL
jgi:hypothetical protein